MDVSKQENYRAESRRRESITSFSLTNLPRGEIIIKIRERFEAIRDGSMDDVNRNPA